MHQNTSDTEQTAQVYLNETQNKSSKHQNKPESQISDVILRHN